MNAKLNAYKKNQVNTVSKEKLVLMLYDGAIKYLNKSLEVIDNNNPSEAHNHLISSQDIIIGLMSGINFEVGKLGEDLFNLYEYMHHRLVEANTTKDKDIVEEVLNMVKELREAWVQIIGTQKLQPKPYQDREAPATVAINQ
ncbi:MAG: hypothetical protein APF76_02295 [Desulfitibacter sp. BRH_c19]|nr:MAG: hypothetical protein APF76_02295 [Desulfitibacter sp. BRH_c19]